MIIRQCMGEAHMESRLPLYFPFNYISSFARESAPRPKISSEKWIEYVRTAFSVDPRIAFSLASRFPAISSVKAEVTQLVQVCIIIFVSGLMIGCFCMFHLIAWKPYFCLFIGKESSFWKVSNALRSRHSYCRISVQKKLFYIMWTLSY